MAFQVEAFTDLSPTKLYQILALREQVFMIEQQISEIDLDGVDLSCFHLFSGDPVSAYCRVLPPEIKGYPSVGRVAVAKHLRGEGIGRRLMVEAIDYCLKNWPEQIIKLSAQAYLEKFYKDLGFEVIGESYMEAGILHLPMKLQSAPRDLRTSL